MPLSKRRARDDLEHWPFGNEASDYVIVQGNPVASGPYRLCESDGSARLGIWRCTEGIFDCNELGDELQTILQGRLILTLEEARTHRVRSGRRYLYAQRTAGQVGYRGNRRQTVSYLQSGCQRLKLFSRPEKIRTLMLRSSHRVFHGARSMH